MAAEILHEPVIGWQSFLSTPDDSASTIDARVSTLIVGRRDCALKAGSRPVNRWTMTQRKHGHGPGRPSRFVDPGRAIRAAAASLVASKGYDNCSLQDIASAIGITKAGLYHYYSNKQDLFDSVILDVLQEMSEAISDILPSSLSSGEKLRKFMTVHANYFYRNRDKYLALFVGRAGGDNMVYSPEQLDTRRTYTATLEEILNRGRIDGEFEFADKAVLARGILGMLNWMARWYDPAGPQTPMEIADDYARIILGGITRAR